MPVCHPTIVLIIPVLIILALQLYGFCVSAVIGVWITLCIRQTDRSSFPLFWRSSKTCRLALKHNSSSHFPLIPEKWVRNCSVLWEIIVNKQIKSIYTHLFSYTVGGETSEVIAARSYPSAPKLKVYLHRFWIRDWIKSYMSCYGSRTAKITPRVVQNQLVEKEVYIVFLSWWFITPALWGKGEVQKRHFCAWQRKTFTNYQWLLPFSQIPGPSRGIQPVVSLNTCLLQPKHNKNPLGIGHLNQPQRGSLCPWWQ